MLRGGWEHTAVGEQSDPNITKFILNVEIFLLGWYQTKPALIEIQLSISHSSPSILSRLLSWVGVSEWGEHVHMLAVGTSCPAHVLQTDRDDIAC